MSPSDKCVCLPKVQLSKESIFNLQAKHRRTCKWSKRMSQMLTDLRMLRVSLNTQPASEVLQNLNTSQMSLNVKRAVIV